VTAQLLLPRRQSSPADPALDRAHCDLPLPRRFSRQHHSPHLLLLLMLLLLHLRSLLVLACAGKNSMKTCRCERHVSLSNPPIPSHPTATILITLTAHADNFTSWRPASSRDTPSLITFPPAGDSHAPSTISLPRHNCTLHTTRACEHATQRRHP
jgi:hypothetical protein